MKFLQSFLSICVLTTGLFAQQSTVLKGKVVDENGIVAGATVTLVPEEDSTIKYATTTNKDGEYQFGRIPAGKYTLSANISSQTKSGISRTVDVNLSGQAAKTVDLEVSTYDPVREEVHIDIAAGTSQPIAEISKTVDLIDANEITDRNEFSLGDALRTVPGFRLQQLGGFGRTVNIKTRGLRNQDTAVLLDGVRFRDASSITGDASAFLSDLVLTDISRVEILRGSGSSLYGTNAIGGVIDLQTNEPRRGFHGSFLGEGGGLGLKRFSGKSAGGTDKLGFTLGVTRTVFSEGIDREDDADNTSASGRIDLRPTGKTNISGRIYLSDAFVRLNSSPDTVGILPASNSTIIRAVPISLSQLNDYAGGQPITRIGSANFIPDTNDPDDFQQSNFFNGQIVLDQIITDKLVFKATYQGLKTSRKNENGVLGVGFQPFGGAQSSLFDGLIQTADAHFNWTPNAGNLLTFGYEFEYEKFGNDGLTADGSGNFSTRAKQTSNTIYVQDLIGFFNNKLQVAGGFRAQFFDLSFPSFSVTNAPYEGLTLEDPPNAYTFDGSVSYFIERSGTKLRAHAGNGYRVPSLYERFGTFYSSYSQDFTALGDPGLKPERSIAFDGGIDQTIFKDRVKLSATYFYTKLLDTIGFGDVVRPIGTTNRPFGGYLNTKGGVARGAEFSGRIRASDSTEFFASYTLTNSDQRAPQVSGSGIIRTLGIPDHQFSLVATQRIKRLTLNFDLLATSDYLAPIFSNTTFSTYVYRFNGNRRADLTGGYDIPVRGEAVRLRVFGTIENLFDFDYFENGFRTTGRTARGGLGISF